MLLKSNPTTHFNRLTNEYNLVSIHFDDMDHLCNQHARIRIRSELNWIGKKKYSHFVTRKQSFHKHKKIILILENYFTLLLNIKIQSSTIDNFFINLSLV